MIKLKIHSLPPATPLNINIVTLNMSLRTVALDRYS